MENQLIMIVCFTQLRFKSLILSSKTSFLMVKRNII